MKEYALAKKNVANYSIPGNDLDQYYSVEILIPELDVIYQFKIWEIESIFMYILVKEDSGLLQRIQTGYRAKMKYYSTDLSCPYQTINTEIRDISWQDRGRLKGHYLVGLEILKPKGRNRGKYPLRRNETRILPFDYSL
jgi:hypothetical protein